ncbi:MAG: tripartite tricarboxylate transporter substrate binding protein [Tabrizicola sp.]|nr:tripartite tricarboxylate transporter substrate binding protein [Tabrizicola sp.]
MTKIARRDTLKFALAAPFVLAGGRSWAQENWPTRPILIVLPTGAGGGADMMMRLVCARVAEILKQPIVIENKSGGSSVAGASYALSQPRDGYTFFNNSSWQVITPLLAKDLPFDYHTSFVPVSKAAYYPQAITVQTDSAIKTPKELIDYARANPGKLRYGTPARGGMGHMAGVEIELRTGTKMVNVAYRNSPDAPRDLAGGTLDAVVASTSTNMPFIQAGKIRPIAVTSAKRVAIMPDVPTLDETILPGYDMDDWSGVFAATGTPEFAINRFQAAFAQACREPEIIAKMRPLGTELVGSTPAEFATFIDGQQKLLGNIIKQANITE